MGRVLTNNDGESVRTVNVYPKDLRVGDVKPGFVSINVGTIVERSIYHEENVVEVVKDTRTKPMTYLIAVYSHRRGTRRFHVAPQARIEIKERS